jgi:uncharacterized protein YcfL
MSNSSQHSYTSTEVRSRSAIPVRYFLIFLVVIALIVPAAGYVALAQQADKPWREVRTIYTEEHGLSNPQGLAFSPDANAFLLWQEGGSAQGITMYEESVDIQELDIPAADVRNIAFNGYANQLYVLGSDNTQVKKIPIDEKGLPLAQNASAQSHDLNTVNLDAARGITFDQATGRMFVLNANGDQLVVLPDLNSSLGAEASIISLKTLKAGSLQGIAFNPQDGHLYLSDATNQRLYKVTQNGKKVSEYDLSSLQLASPKTLVFAPSADRTDDPSNMDLFLLDSGQAGSESGQIVELALDARADLPGGIQILPATLVRVQDTNNTVWNPSAPDPSGIDYWPQKNRFVITDSEVDEMKLYWQGANVFTATTSGTLLSTCSTMAYNNEPTGLAINPNTNRIYISSDRSDGTYFEINIGPDGAYCTSDDVVSKYTLLTDLEDVAYGNNTLFLAGGVDAEVYYFNLGPDQVIGGGDDGPMQHFDTNAWGFTDMEGIGFHGGNGTILIHGSMANGKEYVAEVSQTGTLLRAYDVSFMTGERIHSDIAYAPSSSNPTAKNIYIVSRGEDNNSNSSENDGKWWEINIGATTPTSTPTFGPSPTPTRTPTATATNTPVLHNIAVEIGNDPVTGSPFSLAVGGSTREDFDNVDAGPLQVSGNVRNLAAERIIYKVNGTNTSFSEMMALPANQLDKIYWLPWYNNAHLDTELRIANVSGLPATVTITIGANEVDSFDLPAGVSTLKSYEDINNGPVKIVSTQNIVAAERVIYKVNNVNTSFSEIMAIPNKELDNIYWLPWYNSVGLDTQLRIGNVSSTPADVTITIGGDPVPGGSFTLGVGESTRVSVESVNDGPVRIESTQNIVAAQRVIYKVQGTNTSFSEMMALPDHQVTHRYWLPWYNDNELDTQLRFANISTQQASVHVIIGGQEVDDSPFTLQPGESTRVSFDGVNAGPVEIISNVDIIAAERVIYQVNGIQTSFSEMMGLPHELLDFTYWLPWYNNVSLDTQLRFAIPAIP